MTNPSADDIRAEQADRDERHPIDSDASPFDPTLTMTNPFPEGTASAFMWENAGYSYSPADGETPEAGRKRGAIALARAEAFGQAAGWAVLWEEDPDHPHWFSNGEDEPETCELAVLYGVNDDPSGNNDNVLASVGCVDDATPEYRRVVEAELMAEAYANISTHEPTDNTNEKG